MLVQLSEDAVKRLENIYKKIDDKKKFCSANCSRCCVDNIEMTYVEFAYLIKGINEKQIKGLCSKNKKGGCIFLDDKGKCIAYERRPWICRNFRRFENGKCGSERIHEGEITDNFIAEMDITRLNNEVAPANCKGIRKLREWFEPC
ncbi:MAG: YkgJ family cysteine cluster protein [Candidatus Aenigmarchaeota archaeon]|nr:YkgJ family cysteine cluster protein [Candidatus Aenigmarchaeota archaeon]